MKPTQLKDVFINESVIGDMYITVGSSIENIENECKTILTVLNKLQDKRGKRQINTILEMVKQLKQKFSDSYTF